MARTEDPAGNLQGPAKKFDSDRSLLRKVRSGCDEAARQLYLRYAPRLMALARAKSSAGLARRLDAEDIVQSVFRTFFRGVAQGYYDVPAGEDLWKLFAVIALNKIRADGAFHRAAKRDVRLTTAIDGRASDLEAPHNQDPSAETFLTMVVEETLERLGLRQREIVELRMQGFEVAEIAQQTNRSKRTVERNLQDIRSKLRTLLPQEP
jgi:RNA polymerase sigma-70 factor (ECF subfamily)